MKDYNELTTEERSQICNGCGAKGGHIPVPNFIFTASCDLHDYNYTIGGSEEDRKRYDYGFYRAMKRDADTFTFPKRQYYKMWAYVYFKAVRKFGSKHFNYTK